MNVMTAEPDDFDPFVKTDPSDAIEALWELGYDTSSIARQLKLAESIIANVIARLVGPVDNDYGDQADKNRSYIIKLAQQGYTPAEIAVRMAISRNAVSQALYRARRDGMPIPAFSARGVLLTESEWRLLELAATRFSTDAHRLAHKIISIVIRENLFAAIIDDEQVDIIGKTNGTS